jgi:sugar phosphate isomerase/epimerase
MVLDPKMRAYERALNPALHGCETFDFAPTDLCALRERVRGFSAFSVHAPLPTPPDYPGRAVTSFLLDPDPQKRRTSLEMLQRTIQVASEWGALYVVVHFAGLHSDGLSRASVVDLARDTAMQLNAWAKQCDQPLHLEYAAYNPSFATPQDLVACVSHHSHLHICLDIGHARVGAEILGIDVWDVVQTLAPYTASMHLWTTRGQEDVRRYHHVPVHPSLKHADGWIDVPGMLEAVLTHNRDCAIVFEPNTLFNSDLDWQAQGVAWVRKLVVSLGGRYGQVAGPPMETRVAGGLGSESSRRGQE